MKAPQWIKPESGGRDLRAGLQANGTGGFCVDPHA